MKKLIIQKFTLAEILVAMAVFSILLVLMMQFFSGAKTLWTANEKRSVVYSDTATVLDLMSSLLQSTFCTFDNAGANQTPFEIVKSSDDDKIYFNSNSRMKLSGGSIRYLSFQRISQSGESLNNILALKIYSDSDADFSGGFWEFNLPSGNNDRDNATTFIRGKLDGFSLPASGTSRNVKILLRNVTGIEFTPINEDGSTASLTTTPVAVKIKLTVMETEAKLREWNAMPNGDAKNNFRQENEYTFYRTVWLGKRD